MAPAFAADARDDRITALEQKLDRSLKLIEQLTSRVNELEAQQATAAAGAQPPAPPASLGQTAPQVQTQVPAQAQPPAQAQTQTRLENVEQQVAQLAEANAARGGGAAGVPLHGFFDVGIGNHTANEPGLKGANVGALDIS